MSEANTLFEIDRELDSLLDQIEEEAEENGTASPELLERFQQFCQAESEKVDRIGRFLTLMDSRLKYCRQQAEHFQKRARSADAKIVGTKNMVLYFLMPLGDSRRSRAKSSRCGCKRTARIQSRSPMRARFRSLAVNWNFAFLAVSGKRSLHPFQKIRPRSLANCIRDDRPSNDAIKEAASRFEEVPGAQVKRGIHLRVA